MGSRAHRLQFLGHMGLIALRLVGSSWTRNQTHVPCIGRHILNNQGSCSWLSYVPEVSHNGKFKRKLITSYNPVLTTALVGRGSCKADHLWCWHPALSPHPSVELGRLFLHSTCPAPSLQPELPRGQASALASSKQDTFGSQRKTLLSTLGPLEQEELTGKPS